MDMNVGNNCDVFIARLIDVRERFAASITVVTFIV